MQECVDKPPRATYRFAFMSREQSPAFQFYPRDFLCDDKVMAMSASARGCYIVLLCHCWLSGSITSNVQELRRLSLYDGHDWPRTWGQLEKAFVPRHGALVNPRIERERQKQATFREMKARAGQAGGKQKASRRLAQTLAKASPPSSSSSSSSSYPRNNKLTSKRKAVPSAQTPSASKSEKAKNVKIITKIAHEVLNQNGRKADADAMEAIKTLCAQRHIDYNAEVVRKALDSAEAQSA